MSYPHSIRLRGPWHYEVLGQTAPAGTSQVGRVGRMQIPADWGRELGQEFRGAVRFRRTFHRPTRLDPQERVVLVGEGADAAAEVSLNDQPLGSIAGYALPLRADVTKQLAGENVVQVDVSCLGGDEESPALISRPGRKELPGGLLREVRLEILSTHWVDDLCLTVALDEHQAKPRLHVSGRVEGAGDEGLELLIKSGRRELHHAQLAGRGPTMVAVEVDDFCRWLSNVVPRIEPVEIRLLRGGVAIWEATRLTAARAVAWDGSERRLTVDGHAVQIDAGEEGTDQENRATATWAEQIHTAEDYERLDRTGQMLIQCVPAAWADVVCRRLAHHPSIVAWGASTTEQEELAGKMAPLLRDGRPWLSRAWLEC